MSGTMLCPTRTSHSQTKKSRIPKTKPWIRFHTTRVPPPKIPQMISQSPVKISATPLRIIPRSRVKMPTMTFTMPLMRSIKPPRIVPIASMAGPIASPTIASRIVRPASSPPASIARIGLAIVHALLIAFPIGSQRSLNSSSFGPTFSQTSFKPFQMPLPIFLTCGQRSSHAAPKNFPISFATPVMNSRIGSTLSLMF